MTSGAILIDPKVVRKEWVGRMRDTLWEPGKRFLAVRVENEFGVERVIFCPMGLLMDTCEKLGIINPGYWIGNVKFWSPDGLVGGESGVLTRQAARAAGLVSKTGHPQVNPGYLLPSTIAFRYQLLPGKTYALGWLNDRTSMPPDVLADLVAGTR